jgi:hypothetical protein
MTPYIPYLSYAVIIAMKGKAYLATKGLTEAGYYHDIDPVYVTNLCLDELVKAVEHLFLTGNPRIPTPSLHDLDYRSKKNDPMLRATNTKSWKELAINAMWYTIALRKDKYFLYIQEPDNKYKGYFKVDPVKTYSFPPETKLQDIVKIVLDDISSRAGLQ